MEKPYTIEINLDLTCPDEVKDFWTGHDDELIYNSSLPINTIKINITGKLLVQDKDVTNDVIDKIKTNPNEWQTFDGIETKWDPETDTIKGREKDFEYDIIINKLIRMTF